MLHYETIHSSTLELLKKLISIKELSKLRLVGGTSLALQIGHRISVDLDLFGELEADRYTLSSILSKVGEFKKINETENILVCSIDGIKVDIVNYPYKWLEEIYWGDDIPLAGQKDIGAMKLAAIAGRGSKKDFVDFYFLLQKFKLNDILQFYNKKYPDGSNFLVLKSLSYFNDAENEMDPNMIIDTKWSDVKKFLIQSLNSHLKSDL